MLTPNSPISNSLDGIALRIFRDGYWQSLFISELQFLTDNEIDGLSWAPKLRVMLEADPRWHRVIDYGWINPQPSDNLTTQTKVHESPKSDE